MTPATIIPLFNLTRSEEDRAAINAVLDSEVSGRDAVAALWTLYRLRHCGPDVAAAFAALADLWGDEWLADVERLPVEERLVVFVEACRMLGLPDAPQVVQVAARAKSELARRRTG